MSDGLIYDTRPLLPGNGSHTIILSYFLPLADSPEIVIPLPYQTRLVSILLQEGTHLRSDQLKPAGVEIVKNQAYDKYIGQNISAGDTLTFTVRASSSANNPLTILLGVSLIALVTVGSLYWLAWGRKASVSPLAAGLTGEEMALIRHIAQLDEAFEAGRINRFEYEARRADLKATLAEELQDK